MKRTITGNIITVCLMCLSLLSNLSEPAVACLPDPNGPPGGGGGWLPPFPPIGADPVFLKTGEYYTSATDLVIWGRVLPVKIVRTYSNQQQYNYGYGYCWDMNYNIKIERVDPNWIVLYDGELRKLNYVSQDGGTTFEGPPSYYDSIEAKGGSGYGPYTLSKKHGTKLDFDLNGKLTKITDRTGNNSINFAYTSGRLTSITDDLNRTITLQYNAEGHLWKITDFTTPPRTWEYEYEDNRLRFVKLPETDEYNGQGRLKITYTYDYNHNLVSITDPRGSTYLTNTYTDDKVTSQTYGDGDFTISYDPDNNKAGITDRKGHFTEIEYNSAGNIIRKSIANPNLSYTTRYEYNSDMERTRIKFPKGNCIDYTYDDKGNLTGIYRKKSSSDGSPISTILTYENVYNFAKTITDPKGNVTTFTYDGVGNLEKITYPAVSGQNPEISFTYNQYGQIETVTAPDAIETKFEYYTNLSDGYNYGRLKKVIRDSGTGGLNVATLYEYDKWGKVEKVIGPDLNTWELTHNELEALTQIKAPSPFNYITKLSYDRNKNLAKLQSQLGPTFDDNTAQTTLLGYNTLDHLYWFENPLGNTFWFSYDKNENLSRIIDPGSGYPTYHRTDFGYDERNLLCKVADANKEGYNQYHGETKFSYDDNGNLSKIEDANKPQGHITLYDYDLYDRLKKITYIGYIYDDYAVNEIYSYDRCSNVISWKNRKGQTFYYQYDALNRLKQKNCPDGRSIQLEYDIAGRLKKVIDSVGGTTEYSYDRLGRVELVKSPDGKTVGYTYDDMGRRTLLTYPDASTVSYEYDALSRFEKVNTSLAEYEYDELSRRTKITLSNDTEALYDYQDKVEANNDNFGNNIETLTHNFDGSVTEEYAYTYDNVGNLTEQILTVTCPPEDPYNMYGSYGYDLIYELLDFSYFSGDYGGISYDTLGNRIWFEMYYYGPQSQLSKEYTMSEKGMNQYESLNLSNSEFPEGLLFTYTYDDNGNLTDIDSSEDSYDYIYDCENRLIEAKKNGQTVGTYTYDFAGRRVTKTVDGTTTKYYYDGYHVIAEYENSTLARKYVYGPGIDEPIRMITSGGSYYYHHDRQGSIVALSDSSGYIVENYQYNAFGQCLVHTDPGDDGLWMTADDVTDSVSAKGNPYTFTGRRYDPETALYYYRARMYDPGDGRFLQTDPIGYAGGLNLYTYVRNNPINFVDPFGLLDIGKYLPDAFGITISGNFIINGIPIPGIDKYRKYLPAEIIGLNIMYTPNEGFGIYTIEDVDVVGTDVGFSAEFVVAYAVHEEAHGRKAEWEGDFIGAGMNVKIPTYSGYASEPLIAGQDPGYAGITFGGSWPVPLGASGGQTRYTQRHPFAYLWGLLGTPDDWWRLCGGRGQPPWPPGKY